MAYSVVLSPSAERDLRRISERDRVRVMDALEPLAADPFRPRPGCDIRKLKGFRPPAYALRVGEYRALYAVEGSEVKVTSVKHRSIAYR